MLGFRARLHSPARHVICSAKLPAMKRGIRSLLIDNYDSYTYNLGQLLADVTGEEPLVVANDAITVQEVLDLVKAGSVQNIVISPGPGTPEEPADVGVVLDVLRRLDNVPLLGICLGHQALAYVHGGSVELAPEPVHGRLSGIQHNGHPLFRNIPSGDSAGFQVVRYHSLHVPEESLPAASGLEGICWTDGGTVTLSLAHDTAAHKYSNGKDARLLMGLAHVGRPHYGVQFHPESIATKYGVQLLHNFTALTAAHLSLEPPPPVHNPQGPPGSDYDPAVSRRRSRNGSSRTSCAPRKPSLRLKARQLSSLDCETDCEAIAQRLGWAGCPHTFWLDSAETERSRFSFLGGPGGPLWGRYTFKLAEGKASSAHGQAQPRSNGASAARRCLAEGTLTTLRGDGSVCTESTTLRSWLKSFMDRHTVHDDAGADSLPFDFWGGLVGYVGYEMKAECGGDLTQPSKYADAAFFFADRVVAVDHVEDAVYLLALCPCDDADASRDAAAWPDSTAKLLQDSSGESATNRAGENGSTNGRQFNSTPQHQAADMKLCFELQRSKEQYLRDIEACMRALYRGDSYEICLTNIMRWRGVIDMWAFYRVLRSVNKAPYAAWLHFGEDNPVVCCSSPERFLYLNRSGVLEARPIKGTAARHLHDAAKDAAVARALAASEKDRAENLMIVDLLRNDLGRVCEPGSVRVPGMMEVESFASVHQLVSTIRGDKAEHVHPVDALLAAFPGGSMTGAPKIRSMQIIDDLEQGPRGIYSGSIGYFSVNGTFDFNIVIRTAVAHEGVVSIGAGGAIVVQSEAEAEYDEMELKASRLLHALSVHLGTDHAVSLQDRDSACTREGDRLQVP